MSITAALVNNVANPGNSSAITSTPDGQILYACYANYGGDIYVSRNGGLTWAAANGRWDGTNVTVGNFNGIACSSDGTIVYAMWTGGGLLRSTNSGANYTLNNSGDINSYGSIATDSTGTKLIACSGINIYLSLNSASTWVISDPFTSSTYSYVACSRDFLKRYAVFNGDIYTSTDPANKVWTILPGNVTSTIRGLTCDPTGTYVFTTDLTNNLYLITGGVRTLVGTSVKYDKITCFGSGTSLGFATTGDGSFQTYTFGGIGGGGGGAGGNNGFPCFLEGSTILCQIHGKDTQVPIEQIKSGTLVKTLSSGYKKVTQIGKTIIKSSENNERRPDFLYKYSTSVSPRLFQDLYVTGRHSVLVDTLTEAQKALTIIHLNLIFPDDLDKMFKTENKYRLMTYINEQAEVVSMETYTIWHFSLENLDENGNYGVYANGEFLVESCSEKIMKSSMELI